LTDCGPPDNMVTGAYGVRAGLCRFFWASCVMIGVVGFYSLS